MDIKQNAWVNALEHWRQPSALVTKDSPLPEVPLDPSLPMLPAEKKFWKGPMTRAWNQGRKSWLREALPIFQGDKEVSGKVRDAQREQWRTIKRRKTIRDSNQEQIKSQIHPEHDEKMNRRADTSAELFKVLQEAKKQGGARAVKVLQYLAAGKTEEETAKLTGITARTVRNYKLKLAKHFFKKK